MLECTRLYLGVQGNLKEKVISANFEKLLGIKFKHFFLYFYLIKQIPDLAAFWMFSLILQLPLQVLFFLLNTIPVERAAQGIMCTLLLSQLVFGFLVLRDMAKHHKLRFHISQFYNGQHIKIE